MDQSDRDAIARDLDIIAEVAKIKTELNEKIRALLITKKATVTELVELTGLTRGRIYQIKHNRR